MHDHDPLAASRMPFTEHLEELRVRLWRALVGFVAILALVFVLDFVGYLTDSSFGVGKPVFNLLALPVERELQRFYDRRAEQVARQLLAGDRLTQLADRCRDVPLQVDVQALADALAPLLGVEVTTTEPCFVTVPSRIPPVAWSVALGEAQRLVQRRPSLKAMSLMEGMAVYLKVALLCGVVLGSPWLFGQAWAFVAAGLYVHEKRLVHVLLPASLGLFFAGIVVCQVWVMPKTIEALLAFNDWLDVEPDLRLREWLGFALGMPLVFGLAFQTPLVMLVLERVGIASVEGFRRQRRPAWFVLAVAAAVLTPGNDFYSMVFLWVPLGVLYEAGIVLCRLTGGRDDQPAADPAGWTE